MINRFYNKYKAAIWGFVVATVVYTLFILSLSSVVTVIAVGVFNYLLYFLSTFLISFFIFGSFWFLAIFITTASICVYLEGYKMKNNKIEILYRIIINSLVSVVFACVFVLAVFLVFVILALYFPAFHAFISD